MAERMSDLEYITNFEIPPFAEAVQELPEKIGKDVSAAVTYAIVNTVNAAMLFKGKKVIIPMFQAQVPEGYEEYEEPVTQALNLGTSLCENIVRCVLSSPNPEEDYRRLLAHYLQNLQHLVDKEKLRKSSFSKYIDF